MSQKVVDILKEKFGAAVLETASAHRDETVVVEAAAWFEVSQFLRDDKRCEMDMMVDLCGVDFPHREPRFEVVMHLHSIRLNHRLRLKARVGDSDGDGAEIKSVTPLWSGANWFERETYDLMGITFIGHPLRKDYPANKIQPLVPFREGYEKLAPFDEFEGMSFGRQVFRTGKAD